MPHLKSAFKRLRQNIKRRLRNRSAKSALKTQIKKFLSTIQTGDAGAASEQYRLTTKMLDKTAAKGIIRKGTAARKKSGLAQKLNKLVAAGKVK